MTANLAPTELGLYVHWPFCRSKCPYCDFNSHVSTTYDAGAFGDALCREMTYMAGLLPAKRPLTSIFFGGGTPSLMPAAIVGKIITHAEALFGFSPTIEITAEANPTSVEAHAMTAFHHAGVNRVSMGVQSLDDQLLGFLGREHSAKDALAALDLVRQRFDNLSIDLIYATPGQTAKAWETMLGRALDLDLPHMSLYQLTIEPGTVFYTRQRAGEKMNLDDDAAADLFDLTQSITASAGLAAYEISNHAKAGAACRHNLAYWHAADWIGIGPGAHGRFAVAGKGSDLITRNGTATRRSPAGWLQAVQTAGHGIETQQHDSAADVANEMMMMGLRLTTGVNLNTIASLCGPQDNWLDGDGLATAIDAGWLDLSIENDTAGAQHSRLRTTTTGRLRLNHLLAMILR